MFVFKSAFVKIANKKEKNIIKLLQFLHKNNLISM